MKALRWAAVIVVSALSHAPARAVTILDPQNPAIFHQDGTQRVTPGNVLTLTDQSFGDFAALFANEQAAAAGTDVDVVASFQVRMTLPSLADAGNRVVINDGQTHSAIAACIFKDGAPGIGLLSQGSPTDPNSYPVFVPVDWQGAPVRIRLHRAANGDVELMEVNGVAPAPRALLTADKAPAPTRAGATVEFGTGTQANPEAASTVEYISFRVVDPATGPVVEPTTLSVANASGAYGGSVGLRATLTRSCDGTPIPGAPVSFTLDGMSVGSATTDAYGVAALPVASLAGIAAGAYPVGVGASFAGDSRARAGSALGSLTVGIGDIVVGCDTADLLAAIGSANTAGGGTLDLAFGCTYTLTQPIPAPPYGPDGLPPITTAITIHGNMATIVRGGTNSPLFRILEVDSSGSLAIDQLTVSGGLDFGYGGGGIFNAGSLIIDRSAISGNIASSGGGIHNDFGGELTLDRSTVSSNNAFGGGGVYNAGTATIDRSTISSCNADNGGGIENIGAMTITRATVARNGNNNGGGISNTGTMTLAQSTIAGNFGGGQINSGGGGVYNTGTITATQSIVADNQSNAVGNCLGTIIDGGYNIEDNTTCGFSQSTSMLTSPQLGPLRDNGGPTFTMALMSGSPAIDAGPATCVLGAQGVAVDQRGVPRPQVNVCDIGAFEFVPPSTATIVAGASGLSGGSTSLSATLIRSRDGCCDGTPVPGVSISFSLNGASVGSASTNGSGMAVLRHVSLTGIVDGTYPIGVGASFAGDANYGPSSGTGALVVATADTPVDCAAASLIAAIDGANAAGGGTLDLAAGCTYTLTQPLPATLFGLNGLPPITTSISIHGHGATIARGGTNPPAFRIFEVDYTGALAIDELRVSGGGGADISGAGIFNAGGTTISRSTLSGNDAGAGGAGGGIYNIEFGELTVTESTISGNVAFNGGGILNDNNATVTALQSTISGNHAYFGGGGVFNSGGDVTIAQSTLASNVADAEGAGIDNFSSGAVRVTGSIVANSPSGNCAGTIQDGGYNLEDGSACGFSQPTSQSHVDPLLGPLQDNGGPTFTQALLPGSPAIDKGTSAGRSTDQRGARFIRTFDDPSVSNASGGDGTDIGAFELQSVNHAPVATCRSVTVSADGRCVASASVDDGSFDPDLGDTLALAQSPPGPYSLGTTGVTLTVTDSHGATSTCLATITVVDTTPPTLAAPATSVANSNISCQAGIPDVLPQVTASDNCGPVTLSQSPTAGTMVGVSTQYITVTARDGANNSSSAQVAFTVVAEPGFTVAVTPNTVKRGGSVTLKTTFNNCATTSLVVTLKVSLTRPGSSTLMVAFPLTLNAGQHGTLSLPVLIPRSTPTGLYTLTLEWSIGGVKIGTSAAKLTVTG